MPINYVTGDATRPALAETEKAIIVHVVNDIGGWGKGFVVAVSRRWKPPETAYRNWAAGRDKQQPFKLGQVQFVQVEPNLWIANLLGQHGIGRQANGASPVRYEAIREGLQRVAVFAKSEKATVHMPRIGSGLAGGKWEIISKIIEEELVARDIPVTVYTLLG